MLSNSNKDATQNVKSIHNQDIPEVGFINRIQEILNNEGNAPEGALHTVLEEFNRSINGEVTFIAEVNRQESVILDRVVREGSSFNITRYNLEGTPCMTIYGDDSHTCIYADVINEIAGDHPEMRRMGITSYFGTALPIGNRNFILVTLTKTPPNEEDVDKYLQLSGIISGIATDLVLRSEGLTKEDRVSPLVKALTHALAVRDIETLRHSQAVGEFAVKIAERISGNPHIQGADTLTDYDIAILRLESELHDVGKIPIPYSILKKPGQLDDDEYRIMKLHAGLTARILSLFPALQKYIPAAMMHHLRFDGRGYPERVNSTIYGENIPIHARIMAIADVIVALTERRPYREPLPLLTICQELEKQSGGYFDPAIIPHVLDLLLEDGASFWNAQKVNLLKRKKARIIGTSQLIWKDQQVP